LKYLLLVLLSTPLFACHFYNSSDSENKVEFAVELALDKAIANKDFRFFATSGRRITLPGVIENEKELLISQCGVKFMPDTGDVLKSEQQRMERKLKVVYMTEYNQRIMRSCRKRK